MYEKLRTAYLIVNILVVGGVVLTAYIVYLSIYPGLLRVRSANEVQDVLEYTSYATDSALAPAQEEVKGEESNSIIFKGRLIVPKIDLDIPIYSGNPSRALEKGVFLNSDSITNPQSEGKLTISGTRFSLQPTPAEVRAKSPFYNLTKLDVGDNIVLVWGDRPYYYTVQKLLRDTDIEEVNPDGERSLILLSVDQSSQFDGSVIVQSEFEENTLEALTK